MRRIVSSPSFSNGRRSLNVASIVARLVKTCHDAPCGSIPLSTLSSAVQWTALERGPIPKSLKKFLSVTSSLALYQHGDETYAAIPRPCSLAHSVDLSSAVNLVEAITGRSCSELDDHENVQYLKIVWILRSEIELSIVGKDKLSVTLGERQQLQARFLTESYPCDEYLNRCVYPLLAHLQSIVPTVSQHILERFLGWRKGWPSLPCICNLRMLGGECVLRQKVQSSAQLPHTFQSCLQQALDDSAERALDIVSLAVNVIFCKIAPRIHTVPLKIEVIEQHIGWGQYRYSLGTIEEFLLHFMDVFFAVGDCGGVMTTQIHNTSAVHVVARLLFPLFGSEVDFPLPSLYAATRWSSLFQSRFGPLQDVLRALGVPMCQTSAYIVVGSSLQTPVAANPCLDNPPLISCYLLPALADGASLAVLSDRLCWSHKDKHPSLRLIGTSLAHVAALHRPSSATRCGTSLDESVRSVKRAILLRAQQCLHA